MPGEQPDVLIYTELTRTLGADFPSPRSELVRQLLRWHPEIEPVRAAAGQVGVFRKLSKVERRALLDRTRSRSVTSCVMLVNRLPQRNRIRLGEALKLRTDVAEADVFLDTEIHVRNPTLRAALLKQLDAFAVCTAALFTRDDAASLDTCDLVNENVDAHVAAGSTFLCDSAETVQVLHTHAARRGIPVASDQIRIVNFGHDANSTHDVNLKQHGPPSNELVNTLHGLAIYA